LRVRQNVKSLLRKARQSKKIHTPLRVRSRVRRWRDSLVSAASDTEEIIFNLTTNVNHAIIKPMSKPLDNHGSKANVGDLVRIYTEAGMDTGIVGVVVEVKEFYSWSMEMWRKVRLHGKLDFIDDFKVRIVSKAVNHARTGRDKNTG